VRAIRWIKPMLPLTPVSWHGAGLILSPGAARKLGRKEMQNYESAGWRCRYRLAKYREDMGMFKGDAEQFQRVFRPYEVVEGEGNCLLNSGIDEIWDLICGGSAGHFDGAGAQIGVGDSAAAAEVTQTDLQAAANKTYKGMDSGYPVSTNRKAAFKASFGENDANYAWNEWVVKQSASGKCLNRKADCLGTKSGGTWVIQVEITLA